MNKKTQNEEINEEGIEVDDDPNITSVYGTKETTEEFEKEQENKNADKYKNKK